MDAYGSILRIQSNDSCSQAKANQSRCNHNYHGSRHPGLKQASVATGQPRKPTQHTHDYRDSSKASPTAGQQDPNATVGTAAIRFRNIGKAGGCLQSAPAVAPTSISPLPGHPCGNVENIRKRVPAWLKPRCFHRKNFAPWRIPDVWNLLVSLGTEPSVSSDHSVQTRSFLRR